MAYHAGMTKLMTVVETPTFLHGIKQLRLNEQEHADLVIYLSANPEKGEIVQGTEGVRKMRYARRGQGKRGGYRVVYYYLN